jgi:hypothetical protein
MVERLFGFIQQNGLYRRGAGDRFFVRFGWLREIDDCLSVQK